ncbi:DinB family protein [Phycicoccus sp. MAQZ13P-2]|uniref:DinB family protein n=1 Tax=Phycicoccus mangrovi TaxID=2840470 RepID=UPI001BFFF6CA|nr:DinB family protein [Phycicoccus mangrovi]MBT9254635.1 DinB family protein [Phycicoccus mangrovi]MBT9273160.1 DinB family protein [Phycicoccus mangrovi]
MLDAFIDEHRAGLRETLAGLTEEQARRRLVPSATTLLGLLKHVTFVERVWSEEAVLQRPRTEIGLPAAVDETFVLDDGDTIASVLVDHEKACATARSIAATVGLDELVHGNRRGPLPMRWVQLHLLRELAQHAGHADILREQVLAADARDA